MSYSLLYLIKSDTSVYVICHNYPYIYVYWYQGFAYITLVSIDLKYDMQRASNIELLISLY